jgi:hypothetical protein
MSTQHRCLTQDQARPGDVNSRVCRSYVEGELSRAKAQQAPYRHEKCVAVTRSSIPDFADELLCGYVCVRNHFRMKRKSCVDVPVIGQGSQFFNLHEGATHRKPLKLDVLFEDCRRCRRYVERPKLAGQCQTAIGNTRLHCRRSTHCRFADSFSRTDIDVSERRQCPWQPVRIGCFF